MHEIFHIILLLIIAIFVFAIVNKIINFFTNKSESDRKKINESYVIYDNHYDDNFSQRNPYNNLKIIRQVHNVPTEVIEQELLSWWNSTRHTKNMSYDIRGDIPPFSYYTGPWNNSSL
jgi:hypothetical protein